MKSYEISNDRPTNGCDRTTEKTLSESPQTPTGNGFKGESKTRKSRGNRGDRLSGSGNDRILAEFQKSAIPDELTIANIEWTDDARRILTENAIAQLGGDSQQYATKPVQRILNRYEFAADGGWVAYGQDLDGNNGSVAYVKPAKPRPKFDPTDPFKKTKKSIKYETPQGCAALPLLAFVPDTIAQQTWQRFEVEPDPRKTYWQNIRDSLKIPVVIVEGFKKALSLIAQGIPAIAIRGITMWHTKGSRELHGAIAAFATPGRTVYVCFDQDEKPKTIADVRKQAIALGSEVEKTGATVRYLHWDQSLGKGVDDVLYGQGDSAGAWVQDTLDKALTVSQYRRLGLIARALNIVHQSEQSHYPVERDTDGANTPGGYLPELPPLKRGAIHTLIAGLGSGKTVRMGADWVKPAIAAGHFCIVLAPMNSLGQQTAHRWELPHIHDFKPSESDILWTMARDAGGVVLCPDSLHKLPSWVWNLPIFLVMDEVNQLVQGLTNAGTLKDRQSDILKIFTAVAERAAATGAIALAEDGVPDHCIKFMQDISQCQVRVFQHKRQQQPWDCTLYGGPQVSGFRAKLLQDAATNKQLFVTSSQREGVRYQRAIAQLYPDIKVMRVDRDTNEGGALIQFFNDPDQWIAAHQPDILIVSPSAKSGVSIEAPWFDSVWGYFPALASDVHWQLLGRYRLPVPRHIYCPPFIQANGDEALLSSRRARQHYRTDAKGMAGVFELEALLEASDEQSEQFARIETAVMDYQCKQVTVQGAMKAIAYDCLSLRLQGAGHRVTEKKAGMSQPVSELWRQLQDEIWQEEAVEFAAIALDDIHTDDWAHRTLNSSESSRINRLTARKVLYRIEFPGVLFNDAMECYEALCLDYGAMRRGVRLQARCENLDAAKAIDADRTNKLLQQDIKAFHRLPQEYIKAHLLAELGILNLLDGTVYHNGESRAIAIKRKALYWANEIYYRLRLQIKSNQTPAEICNKLLRKLGLEIDKPDRPGAVIEVARPGKRGGQRDRHYRVDLDYSPVRKQLLEAAQRKLSESVPQSVPPICKGEDMNPIQNMDTPDLDLTEFTDMNSIALATEGENEEILEFLSQFSHILPAI